MLKFVFELSNEPTKYVFVTMVNKQMLRDGTQDGVVYRQRFFIRPRM